MNPVNFDGRRMTDRQTAHLCLAQGLDFPAWYGRNLDALWDMLGDISRPTHIRLYSCEALLAQLDGYGRRLLTVLEEAAEANPSLALTEFYGLQAPKE